MTKPDEQLNEQSSFMPALLCRWHAGRKAARKAARVAQTVQFAPDETGHTEMPLSRMQPGEFGHVLALRTDSEVRDHLLELGFTPGVEVTVVRVAPLGDLLTVRIRGYQLSLRRREAEAVQMRRCPPDFDLYPDISEENALEGDGT